MNIKVSVIVPVYNQEKYLPEAIESILNQTFTNFELIIANDGSSDNSSQIIEKYATIDKRIIAYSFETNVGKANAVNKAVSMASGDLLAFMDNDDVMMLNRLERQVAFYMANPHVDAISSHCYCIDKYGTEVGIQRYPGLKTELDSINAKKNNQILICAFTALTVTKRLFKTVGGLNQRYWPCDDYDYVNRILEHGFILIIMREVLMMYRVHNSSITSQKRMDMWNMKSFLKVNILERRAGIPETTFEEFKNNISQKNRLENFKYKNHVYAIAYHKKAGFALNSRKYLRFIREISIAAVLDPKFVLASAKKNLIPVNGRNKRAAYWLNILCLQIN